jgi:hypothetical protein
LGNFTALLDASVLYSAPLRDLLLELAVSDLYRATWSDAVHGEWITAVLENRPDLTRAVGLRGGEGEFEPTDSTWGAPHFVCDALNH